MYLGENFKKYDQNIYGFTWKKYFEQNLKFWPQCQARI